MAVKEVRICVPTPTEMQLQHLKTRSLEPNTVVERSDEHAFRGTCIGYCAKILANGREMSGGEINNALTPVKKRCLQELTDVLMQDNRKGTKQYGSIGSGLESRDLIIPEHVLMDIAVAFESTNLGVHMCMEARDFGKTAEYLSGDSNIDLRTVVEKQPYQLFFGRKVEVLFDKYRPDRKHPGFRTLPLEIDELVSGAVYGKEHCSFLSSRVFTAISKIRGNICKDLPKMFIQLKGVDGLKLSINDFVCMITGPGGGFPPQAARYALTAKMHKVFVAFEKNVGQSIPDRVDQLPEEVKSDDSNPRKGMSVEILIGRVASQYIAAIAKLSADIDVTDESEQAKDLMKQVAAKAGKLFQEWRPNDTLPRAAVYQAVAEQGVDPRAWDLSVVAEAKPTSPEENRYLCTLTGEIMKRPVLHECKYYEKDAAINAGFVTARNCIIDWKLQAEICSWLDQAEIKKEDQDRQQSKSDEASSGKKPKVDPEPQLLGQQESFLQRVINGFGLFSANR